MNRASSRLALLCALWLGPAAHAMFLPPETVLVPADRLIANLEKRLATKPAEGAQIRRTIGLHPSTTVINDWRKQ